MNMILIFLGLACLPLAAIADEARADPAQLLRDYESSVLDYQEAMKIYRARRREVRADPELRETVFGSSRPVTGLRLGPLPDGGKGVWVRSVIPGSLAEQAGLLAGDVILAVDGDRFDHLFDARAVRTMVKAIGKATAGTTVRIEYLRDGEINVTDTRTQSSSEIVQLRAAMFTEDGDLKQMPGTIGAAREIDSVSHWSGLTFADMTPGLGRYFGAEAGVLLLHYRDKHLPLMEGDIILKIDKQAPADAAQAVKLLQAYDHDEPVVLQIWRHGQLLLLEFAFIKPMLVDTAGRQSER